MSRNIFVDTGAFLALANAGDQYHKTATECLASMAGVRQWVTTNFVLDETYTRIRRKVGPKVAVAFGEKIRSDSSVKIVTIEKKLEEKAWEIFKRYTDHPFSYTDCTSFALMLDQKITEAFAFDKDFKILGFSLLPAL